MISGGIESAKDAAAKAAMCQAPNAELKRECEGLVDQKKTADGRDTGPFMDISYFCGHDQNTFKRMSPKEKDAATLCMIDVFKNVGDNYKEGSENNVTVRGKTEKRKLDFAKSKAATPPLPVVASATLPDDLFKKAAGRPTRAEEKAIAEKAAAEEAAKAARVAAEAAADQLVQEKKYDEAIAAYEKLKTEAPAGTDTTNLDRKITEAKAAKEKHEHEEHEKKVPDPKGSVKIELNYGGEDDIFGKGVAKGEVHLTTHFGVRGGVEYGNKAALVYEGTPFALVEGESPESDTSGFITAAAFYDWDLAGEKTAEEEKKEKEEGGVSKKFELSLGVQKYGHIRPGFGPQAKLSLEGSKKVKLEEIHTHPAAAGSTEAPKEEVHEEEEVAPFWSFNAMLYGGSSRATMWGKEKPRGLFEDGLAGSLMIDGEYSPVLTLEKFDPKKDPRTKTAVTLFFSGSYALGGNDAKPPMDMDVAAVELGLRGKANLGIPMSLEIAGGVTALFPEEGETGTEKMIRVAYQGFFSRSEEFWVYLDASYTDATRDIEQRENTPNVGLSNTIEVGTNATQVGGGLGAKLGGLALKLGVNWLDLCGVEGDDEVCGANKTHLFVGLGL